MEATLDQPVVTTKSPFAKRGRPVKKAASTGPVVRGEVYTREQFLERTKWSVHALKNARKRGLRAMVEGNILFIRGDDFHDWLGRDRDAK